MPNPTQKKKPVVAALIAVIVLIIILVIVLLIMTGVNNKRTQVNLQEANAIRNAEILEENRRADIDEADRQAALEILESTPEPASALIESGYNELQGN